MAYEAGRLQIYVDNDTVKEDYTNATYDSMTDPLVAQLCSILGMHIITSLTTTTSKGKRYFIGYSDSDPKLAVGWCVNNTYSSAIYLLAVQMFDGDPIVDLLDRASSSYISVGDGYAILISRTWGNNNYYYFFNYIKDDNVCGITESYYSTSSTYYYSLTFKYLVMKLENNNKMLSWIYSNGLRTFDYENNGIQTNIITAPMYFRIVKDKIANSDFEYIVQIKLDHNTNVKGLYLYSKVLSTNKLYNINGEYYFSIMSNSNDGTYLIKVGYTPPAP